MTTVNVRGLVRFDGCDVWVNRLANLASGAAVLDSVRLALKHNDNPLMVESHCGGSGPLAQLGEISFETFLEVCEADRQRRIAARAKLFHTTNRRQEFNRDRDRLALLMIDNGIPYVCNRSNCFIVMDLDVDHIIPLSRGGSDDPSNLQFLCRSRNSMKGDRTEQ